MAAAHLGGSATTWHIQVYTFADGATRQLPETENGTQPTVSPDGKWIAFESNGGLRKIAIGGGSSQRLCDAVGVIGLSWLGNDSIVFGEAAGLKRVSAAGGTPETLTTIEPGESRHVTSFGLPGAAAVLFTVLSKSGTAQDAAIAGVSVATRKRSRLLSGGTDARYSPSGHLVYTRQSDVMAIGFDPGTFELRGTPFLAVSGVHVTSHSLEGLFDLAADGTFVYVGVGDVQRTLVWVDRRGGETALPVPHRLYMHPALLPGEGSLIVEIEETPHSLWHVDLTTGALTRLTDESGNHRPVASPDGRFFAFSSDRTKPRSVFRQASDGSGDAQRLTTPTADQNVTSWSRNGRWLALVQAGPKTSDDIWVLPLDGKSEPRPLLNSRHAENSGVFSPDAKWIAYSSDESGRSEVMIRAFPDDGARKQVSTAGGQTPAFSDDGRTLYYRSNNQIWAASIATDPVLTVGVPAVAFELPGVPGVTGLPNYVVSRSGERVLAVKYLGGLSGPRDLQVIVNWFDIIRRADQAR